MSILRWKRQAKPITGLFVSLFFILGSKTQNFFGWIFFHGAFLSRLIDDAEDFSNEILGRDGATPPKSD
jgi:hypothetical protein